MRFWVLCLSIVWFVSFDTALAERWYKLYDQAEDDMAEQRWQAAIVKLKHAVAQNPTSGASVRGEGTKRMAYFPYFLLGKAYYHLGRYDQATKFFKQEAQSRPAGRVATEIHLYQSYLRAIQADRQRMVEFDRIVKRAEAAQAKASFSEAAEALRRARDFHPSEFERRNLGQILANLLDSEKKRTDEQARRGLEERFRALVQDATRNEKQGRLSDAGRLLLEADRLVSGRPEVIASRRRIQEREGRYAGLRHEALEHQREGRIPEAVEALRLAEAAHPEQFRSDHLSDLATSLAREIEIERDIRARAKRAAAEAAAGQREPDRHAAVRKSRPAVKETPAGAGSNAGADRRAVLSAYLAHPEDAVRLLENVRARRKGRNAELESSTGIAYARLSFLTVDPAESEKLKEKASRHFRLALALDPRHQLDPRLVAPQIIELFAAVR